MGHDTQSFYLLIGDLDQPKITLVLCTPRPAWAAATSGVYNRIIHALGMGGRAKGVDAIRCRRSIGALRSTK